MNEKIITLACCISMAMAYAETPSVAVSSSHMYKVNASTDVLGRQNSKVAKTPKTFLVDKKPLPVALARSGDEGPIIEASTGRYEKYKVNGNYTENYWFNGQWKDSSSYVYSAAQYDQRLANTIDFQGRNYVNYNYLSANYAYSKAPNAYYGQTKYIDNNDNTQDAFYDINTLIADNYLYNNAIAMNERGQGIGVYVMESARPNADDASFKPVYTCPQLANYPNKDINHASKVVKIIKHLASNATVYTIDKHCLGNADDIYPTRPDLYSPNPIYIGNHSYGTGNSNIYTSTAQYIDNYVYNTRVIEVASAGNFATAPTQNKNISQTGQAFNVITVGAAQRHDNGKYSYYAQSSIKNPRLPMTKESETSKYYDKPEIINMANVFFNKGYTYTYNYGKTESYAPTFGHTSSAAPYTVGMIADLLHQKPFYKWHPEVVKALLLTSSVLPLESNTNQQNDIDGNTNKLVGRGMPSYKAMVYGNRSRYWIGNKDDHFTTGTIYYGGNYVSKNAIVFEEPNIKAGKTYRIAIAWLVDGDYVKNNGAFPQDIDLMVSQVGTSTEKYSTSATNPFEMVEFKAENNNNLKITILRFHNNGNNRVMLGYNLYEVP